MTRIGDKTGRVAHPISRFLLPLRDKGCPTLCGAKGGIKYSPMPKGLRRFHSTGQRHFITLRNEATVARLSLPLIPTLGLYGPSPRICARLNHRLPLLKLLMGSTRRTGMPRTTPVGTSDKAAFILSAGSGAEMPVPSGFNNVSQKNQIAHELEWCGQDRYELEWCGQDR
jgi:hypothetical protein